MRMSSLKTEVHIATLNYQMAWYVAYYRIAWQMNISLYEHVALFPASNNNKINFKRSPSPFDLFQ